MLKPWRRLFLASTLAGSVLVAQAAFSHLLSGVPSGTRASGAGASVSTALFLMAGYLLGWLERRRGSAPSGDWRPVPWMQALLTSGFIAAVGALGRWTGVFDTLFHQSASAAGSMARAMLTTDAVLFAPAALVAIGAGLGVNSPRRAAVYGGLGALGLIGLSVGLRQAARELVYDPSTIGTLTTLGVGVSALVVGFTLAWVRRRLAFVEMALVALMGGYVLYLGVALGPSELVASWSLPIEQILLALSIVPSVALMALLAVGGSLGYLLFGSGRFDPSFAYEVMIARRYLQVNLRGTRGSLVRAVTRVGWAAGLAGAGLFGFRLASWWGMLLSLLLAALWLRGGPHRLGSRFRRAVFLSTLFGVVGLAGYPWLGAGGTLGVWIAAALRVALLYRRGATRRVRSGPPFVGVVTVISVVGVALGVMALIVVLSVMSGFEDDLKSKILGAHAHIVVEKYGNDFEEYRDVERQVRGARGVQTAAAFVLGDAIMSTDAGLSGALVKGINPNSSDAVRELKRNLERGRVRYLAEPSEIPGACGKTFLPPRPPTKVASQTGTRSRSGPIALDRVALMGSAECTGRVLPGIIIGKALSRTLRAYVGDIIKLVSPVSDEIGPLGPTPKLRRFRVAGIFYSGMYEYDAKLAYIDMKRAQSFFGMRKKATGVELTIRNVDASGRVVSDLERRLGGRPYRVKDWREMNKELFSALLLEKIAMFVALTMIITVASFLIVATLVMIVLQRGREIAILKSLGASSASIMKIFVVQGVVVGVGGALLGVSLGVVICLLLETVGLRLDERVFYIEKLPVVLNWTEVGIIAAAAMIITYLATIYPAMTAAILRPVDGLRED